MITLSLSLYVLSPCIQLTRYPYCVKLLCKLSQPLLVSVKMIILSCVTLYSAKILSSLTNFSDSSTISMFYFIIRLADRLSEPTCMCIGFTRKSLARFYTSLGQVADHMTVCLSGLIYPIIFLIWGSNPISSILSASSRTRQVTLFRLVTPDSKKSINLPGVAITTWAPLSRSLL